MIFPLLSATLYSPVYIFYQTLALFNAGLPSGLVEGFSLKPFQELISTGTHPVLLVLLPCLDFVAVTVIPTELSLFPAVKWFFFS
jgi:hypothetical protein